MGDWRSDWHEMGVAYLNVAAQAPMPRVAIAAAERALAAKKTPHIVPESSYFELSHRVRASLASLVGGQPEEIALTTGASAGPATLAMTLPWRAGDEVLTTTGEFPLQYTVWGPMAEREGVTLRAVAPSGRFVAAGDLIAALGPRTRLVSVSLVRFEDGSLLDAPLLAKACHDRGVWLCLDVSQCCGAMPIDVGVLGADFLTCAGYKWLLSPFGTGFFWMKREHLHAVRPGPFYWMAAEGARDFVSMEFSDPKPARNASRWDTPEWNSAFNLNLAAMEAAVAFVQRAGAATVQTHNQALVDRMFAGLAGSEVELASPVDPSRRGPFGCFRAKTPEKTRALFERLMQQGVIVSLREGNIRVSPYLYNSEDDIDRLLAVVTADAGQGAGLTSNR